MGTSGSAAAYGRRHRSAAMRPGWLHVVPAAWLAVVVFHLVLSAVGLPQYLAALRTVCLGGSSCDPWQIDAVSLTVLGGGQLSVGSYAGWMFGLQVLHTAVFLTIAVVLARRRGGDRFALWLSLCFVAVGTLSPAGRQVLFDHTPVLGVLADFTASLGWAAFFVLLFYRFPDDRFVPRWTRWFAPVWLLVNVPAAVSLERWAPSSPLNYEHWHPTLAVVVLLALVGSGVAAQVVRYRATSDPVLRQQVKWVVFGLAIAVVGSSVVTLAGLLWSPVGYPGLLVDPVGASLITIFYLMVPVAIAVAVLRHRLWDIDLLINRTLVYGALTVAVTGTYVLVVAGLGSLFRVRDNLLLSLVAAGLVAVAFAPARSRLQRLVNRLTYGERDEPYEALARLGRRLEESLAPDVAMVAVVRSIADALRLPYAAVELFDPVAPRTVAAVGEPTQRTVRLPLVYAGQGIGNLVLAPRRGDRGFGDADRRLLEDLARQTAVAANALRTSEEALRLSADLQRSRELLIATREEERRRLRRDLHDGLGPMLSSLTLQLDVAASLLEVDPRRAEAILGDLKAQSRTAVADIRRLVHGLRPPTLDERGLVGAIHDQAARFRHDGLEIDVDVSTTLDNLPAAVEVAAYRIVQEALTNVAHHAAAGRCSLRAEFVPSDGGLHLQIVDDGCGFAPECGVGGVGLVSMRERAAELGGRCVIASRPHGGTRVDAWLPGRDTLTDTRR